MNEFRKYLTDNGKRLYHNNSGFFLEYPSNWDLKESINKQQIKIKNVPYIFSLKVIPVEKNTTIKEDNSQLVRLRNSYLLIQYRTEISKKHETTNKDAIETRKLMGQITQSIRE